MLKKHFLIGMLAASIVLISSCSLIGSSSESKMTLSGAWDIISPWERKVIPAFQTISNTQIQLKYSSSPIEQIRQGKIDIAVIGREPSSDELKGLKEFTVAYDAVCIVIDANSYEGGEFGDSQGPIRKSTGFKDVNSEDLKTIFSYYIKTYGQRWYWQKDYYTYKQTVDLDTAKLSDEKSWVRDAKVIVPTLKLLPGKFDTQTHLYQALGLSEKDMAQAWNNIYSDPQLNAEEEILSVEYPFQTPYIENSGDFVYKIEFASRRVIPVALEHIPIKVVAVNGFNPLVDVQSIYHNDYPLSRKIYLITKNDSSQTAKQLVYFLLSSEGQQILKNAGYLPLP